MVFRVPARDLPEQLLREVWQRLEALLQGLEDEGTDQAEAQVEA